MGAGLLVGAAAALWVAFGIQRTELHWMVAVGLVKLTIVAALGLMAAGAVLGRIANRQAAAADVRSQIDSGVPGTMPVPDEAEGAPAERPDRR
jgi:hypothetical protein